MPLGYKKKMSRFKSEIEEDDFLSDDSSKSCEEDKGNENTYDCDADESEKDVTRSGKKKYVQRPRKEWFSDPYLKDWIIIDGKNIKCRFCEIIFKNVKYSSFKVHSSSNKHRRAEARYKECNDSNLAYSKLGETSTTSEFDTAQPIEILIDEKNNIQEHFYKSSAKKRKFSESSEDVSNDEDFKAMKLAIEKDKVKAIGDMSKQISSAIRYLADSIRLAVQNTNFSKKDKT